MTRARLDAARCPIRTWPQFGRRIRPRGGLLGALPCFTRPVLVSGCQRSGGTMLAGVISRHPDVADFSWGKDAELDGALLLAGVVEPPDILTCRRACFQTSYLNECYLEYLQHAGDFSLIWLIRNPHSVVYSMLYNWKRFALNELFISCGARHLEREAQIRHLRHGPRATRAIVRACLSYVDKAVQAQTLARKLPRDAVMFLEYETLVSDQSASLDAVGRFAGLAMNGGIGDGIRADSLAKATRLSAREASLVDELCGPAYADLQRLVA